ncbi:MAG: hypothetical protein WKF32_05260 [Thermoleophilaceae bacterium]
MSKNEDNQRKKPDGSAYAAHLAGVTERNKASQKEGQARREERELGKVKDRMEVERRQDATLRDSR